MSTHKEFIGFFTRKLRDRETALRKCADLFHRTGAWEKSDTQSDRADHIGNIVEAMIQEGEVWKPVETVEVVTGAAFGKTLPDGEGKRLDPVKCKCGGNPIYIPYVMQTQVESVTDLDHFEYESQNSIHQSLRCLKCGNESAVKEHSFDTISEWNKLNE